MKKIVLIFLLTSVYTTSIFAQNTAKCFDENSSTVSIGYGFISPYKNNFKLPSIFSAFTDLKTKFSATGPIGLTYEWGVAKHISVGVQVNYSKVKNTITQKDGIDVNKDLIVKQDLEQVFALLRANYHFATTDKLDPYVGFGVGYGSYKLENSSNDPEAKASDFDILAVKKPNSLKIAGQLGVKYYINPKFGFFGEVGNLAASYVQVGITTKF